MSFSNLGFKAMRQLLTTGIIALNILTILGLSNSVRAEAVRDCSVSLTAAQNRLTRDRDLEITMRSFDISEGFPDHPANRPIAYQFLLKGKAAETIMRSRQFQKVIATDIIESCGSVGRVTFALWGSGWSQTVGMLNDGRIDVFECIDPPGRNSSSLRDPRLTWGREYCSL
jgi:hypothetical protein